VVAGCDYCRAAEVVAAEGSRLEDAEDNLADLGVAAEDSPDEDRKLAAVGSLAVGSRLVLVVGSPAVEGIHLAAGNYLQLVADLAGYY